MLIAVRTFWRILARRWPVLAAWFLGAEAFHYLLINLAGWAGSHSALAGLLLLPLAVLARLVAYVAMYLVVRNELPAVRARTSAVHGIRDFAGAVSTAMLPFLIFYIAWGLLEADRRDYASVAAGIALRRDGFSDPDGYLVGRVMDVQLGWLPITALILALVLRTVFSLYAERMPGWLGVPAVYVEAVWVLLLLSLVQSWILAGVAWLSSRAGWEWLYQIGADIAAAVPMIGVAWESVGGLWGVLSTVIFLPAAWVAIVGSIYGERDDAEIDVSGRSRLMRLVHGLGRRVEDIALALRLVWRAGPIAVGAYLLAYAAWRFADAASQAWLPRVFGPQTDEFWMAFGGLIAVAIAAVIEPVRVAVIASAYDTLSGVSAREDAAAEGEPEPLVAGQVAVDLDAQRGADVIGNEEGDSGQAGPVV